MLDRLRFPHPWLSLTLFVMWQFLSDGISGGFGCFRCRLGGLRRCLLTGLGHCFGAIGDSLICVFSAEQVQYNPAQYQHSCYR